MKPIQSTQDRSAELNEFCSRNNLYLKNHLHHIILNIHLTSAKWEV